MGPPDPAAPLWDADAVADPDPSRHKVAEQQKKEHFSDIAIAFAEKKL